jgi:hypothetical protein
MSHTNGLGNMSQRSNRKSLSRLTLRRKRIMTRIVLLKEELAKENKRLRDIEGILNSGESGLDMRLNSLSIIEQDFIQRTIA